MSHDLPGDHGFYRVTSIAISTPQDYDGDGDSDVLELGRPGLLKPKYPCQAHPQDYRYRIEPEQGGQHSRDPQEPELRALQGFLPKAVHGIKDDRDDGRLDPEQKRRNVGQRTIGNIQVSEDCAQKNSRENEARSRDNEAASAGLFISAVDGHFRGVRAGDQVRGADQVEEVLVVHPLALPNDLVFHHCDMGGRSTERNQAELEEEGRQGSKIVPL